MYVTKVYPPPLADHSLLGRAHVVCIPIHLVCSRKAPRPLRSRSRMRAKKWSAASQTEILPNWVIRGNHRRRTPKLRNWGCLGGAVDNLLKWQTTGSAFDGEAPGFRQRFHDGPRQPFFAPLSDALAPPRCSGRSAPWAGVVPSQVKLPRTPRTRRSAKLRGYRGFATARPKSHRSQWLRLSRRSGPQPIAPSLR